MAAKKEAPKTVAVKQPAKPLWMWMEKGEGESYDTFKSYEAALESARYVMAENYRFRDKNSKPPVIQFFQQVSEVQFAVKIEEVPVTQFKVTLV